MSNEQPKTKVNYVFELIKTHGLAVVISVAAVAYIGYSHYQLSNVVYDTVKANKETVKALKENSDKTSKAVKALEDKIEEITKPRIQN